MQKENLEEAVALEDSALATSENESDRGECISAEQNISNLSGENEGCAADSKKEFETLIKGKYKEAFDERVQSIINKRFKEIKKSEAKAEKRPSAPASKEGLSPTEIKANKDTDYALEAAEIVAMGYKDFHLEKEMENPTFKALLDGGVDLLTAYQALHIDEIMDTSVRFGAEKAAKQMADSIRFKVARPSENGLYDRTGFGTRKGVSSLTPKQRRELARRALMGENVGF